MPKTNGPARKFPVSLISREQRKKLAARDTPYYQAIGDTPYRHFWHVNQGQAKTIS
jgi:hypothetical protein